MVVKSFTFFKRVINFSENDKLMVMIDIFVILIIL